MKSPGCCCCPVEARPRSSAGVALITVLLVVFLSTVTAASLATLQQIAIRRSTVLQHQQQAHLYALGAEQWAKLILERDLEESETDHPGEEWANLPPARPFEGGTLVARITDLQGCFNLNNLWRPAAAGPAATPDPNPDADADAEAESPAESVPNPDADASAVQEAGRDQMQIQHLQRLLISLDLDPALAQAIADWIDPDSDPQFPDGAEDSYYLVQDPPYLAANRPMSSRSELRLVKGVDRDAYAKLAPVVCALPPGTPLNVNTAPAPVLAALGEGLDPVAVERLLENRPDEGYQSVDEFLSAVQLTLTAPEIARLSVSSQYFRLSAEVRVGDGRAVLYSILHRQEGGIRVLYRSFSHED
ncbi:MAG: general secretion pathway protein GspK [Candidatus Competibacteraceae bacterium]|nr:MAG: general secretion pathway protein GspK [Candidatus Competibacteraceae bacterium]